MALSATLQRIGRDAHRAEETIDRLLPPTATEERPTRDQVIDAIRAVARHPMVRSLPLAAALLDETLELERKVQRDPDLSDPRWEIRESAARLVQLLRAVRRQVERRDLDDPAKAAAYVLRRLEGVEQAKVARLLGVDPRTLRHWRGAPNVRKDPDRVRAIAQTLAVLGEGIPPWAAISWFEQPRFKLGGKSPLKLLEKDAARHAAEIVELAQASLGQLAT